MTMDPYSLLKVPRTADAAKIKRAYRRLARRFHPDVCGRNMQNIKRFLEIKDAYKFLLTKSQKSISSVCVSADGSTTEPCHGDLRDGSFLFVTLNARDALFGTSIDMEVTDREAYCPKCSGLGRICNNDNSLCPECGGKGYSRVSWSGAGLKVVCNRCNGTGAGTLEQCRLCRGTGKVVLQRRVRVNVPAGTRNGTTLKIPGQGAWDHARKQRSMLFVEVEVDLPESWRIVGKDIVSEMEIDCWTHLGGGYLTFRTIEGTEKVFTAPGELRNGRFVLQGRGWVDENGNRGDHIYILKIIYPSAPCPSSALKYMNMLKALWPANGLEKRAICHQK